MKKSYRPTKFDLKLKHTDLCIHQFRLVDDAYTICPNLDNLIKCTLTMCKGDGEYWQLHGVKSHDLSILRYNINSIPFIKTQNGWFIYLLSPVTVLKADELRAWLVKYKLLHRGQFTLQGTAINNYSVLRMSPVTYASRFGFTEDDIRYTITINVDAHYGEIETEREVA